MKYLLTTSMKENYVVCSNCLIFFLIQKCEKDLTSVSKKDKEKLSFVFYMREQRSGECTFESVCCEDWFLNAKSNIVNVTSDQTLESRYFHQFKRSSRSHPY